MLRYDPLEIARRFHHFLMNESKKFGYNASVGHATRAARLTFVATGVIVNIDADPKQQSVSFFYREGNKPREIEEYEKAEAARLAVEEQDRIAQEEWGRRNKPPVRR